MKKVNKSERGEIENACYNNAPITLSTFPKEFITSVLMAMASSLKGVVEVRSLELFLGKRD